MILHPGILALLLGEGAVLLVLLHASYNGLRILRHWDLQSSSELQLQLERRTWLISTLVNYGLGFQAISLLLFVYTADSLHPLFTGAMCATGTLNAADGGWQVLGIKCVGFFLSGLWVVLNRVDQRADNFPLLKLKYLALFLLLPLVLLDGDYMIHFFLGLQPQIITSCCGSLFSSSGTGVASGLAALPIQPMIWVFFLSAAGLLALFLLCLKFTAGWLRAPLGAAAAGFMAVGIASVISFISIYYYQLPTHHCPFDLLQKGYHFIGYPLYVALFGTVFAGLAAALLGLLRRVPGLRDQVLVAERVWLWRGVVLLLVLCAIVSWPLLFGAFSLRAYF